MISDFKGADYTKDAAILLKFDEIIAKMDIEMVSESSETLINTNQNTL